MSALLALRDAQGTSPPATPPAEAPGSEAAARWADAMRAAALIAVDPAGLGGACLRALPGPLRDRFLAALRRLLPEGTPFRRLPPDVPDARLLGGLDLAATLAAGRPVAERGLLAEADGGLLLGAMAERLAPGMAARLAAVLDRGEVAVERDGFAFRAPARLGLIALDEGMSAEEGLPAPLGDRLAFWLPLEGIPLSDAAALPEADAPAVAAARARLAALPSPTPALVEALCGAALALGIASLRAPILALRAASAAAALAGRAAVEEADVALAARLVLAPRATLLPDAAAPPEAPPPPEDPPEKTPDTPPPDPDSIDPAMLQDLILAAAAAAIPPDLLSRLRLAGGVLRRGGATPGRSGAQRNSPRHGRPIGSRAGELRGGARLSLLATLRAAAPWQALRRQARGPGEAPRLEVRREDVRITRFRQRMETVAIFVVDASGSAALNRLAEAKGAVELLLSDCYVRRDRVALIAFRGATAELLLPPTNSLVRARRSLAGLPGGGGTPLAAAIDAAVALADAVRRKGQTPLLVLLTDGKANVARDGSPGRPRAEEEALDAARRLRAMQRGACLVVDTSPRPQAQARALAEAMGARYLPLPYAGAEILSRAVRAAT